MDPLFFVFIALVGALILVFIVTARRDAPKPSRRRSRGAGSGRIYDPGDLWSTTDQITTSHLSDTTPHHEHHAGVHSSGSQTQAGHGPQPNTQAPPTLRLPRQILGMDLAEETPVVAGVAAVGEMQVVETSAVGTLAVAAQEAAAVIDALQITLSRDATSGGN